MIIACDPGANGAFAMMNRNRNLFVLRTAHGYKSILDHLNIEAAGIEDATIEMINTRPGDGGFRSYMTKELNQNVGRAKLCYELAGIKYTELSSQKWQLKYGLGGMTYAGRKDGAVKQARLLFPEHKVTHADADALLMLDYRWHTYYGIPFKARDPKIITELTITKVVDDGKTSTKSRGISGTSKQEKTIRSKDHLSF